MLGWFNHLVTGTLLRFSCTDTMGHMEGLIPLLTTFVPPVLNGVEAHPFISCNATQQAQPAAAHGERRTATTAEPTCCPSSFNAPIQTTEKCHLLFPVLIAMTPWILPSPPSQRGRGDNFCYVYRGTNPDGDFESSRWSVTTNYFPPQGLHKPTWGFRIPWNCKLHIPMLKL